MEKILHVLKTAMAAVSNAPSYKPTQFLPEGLAIRSTQTINSADASIVAYASLSSKLKKRKFNLKSVLVCMSFMHEDASMVRCDKGS